MAHDIVIRGGTVVDGSGSKRFSADVGIKDGVIAEVGRITAPAARTIDADGLIVSPGFIDGHTHMDAQVAWDPLGSCSCWHGVTSVVMSNCGFALAPCKPEDRDLYARCLSAVEDIPTEAMAAGIDWTWETFPEYLATVERLPKAINYGMYIGHSALRMYAMGRRAFTEKATEDEMVRMADLVKEALRAGAMGFSSSRASTHVTPDNTPVASRIAEWEEIDRIVAAMAELDAGIFQVGPDIASGAAHRAFLARLREVALAYKRPIMFGVLATKQGDDPTGWAYQTRYIDETVAAGGRMFGQGTTRSINAIFSLKSYLPFDVLPAWRKVRDLPLDEQKRRLADPEVRRELVAAEERMKPRDNVFQGGGAATTDPRKPDYSNLYVLNGVDWDDPTVEQLSKARGKHPVEVMIDLSLANENQVYVQPLVNETPDDVLGILKHPRTLATFSDSGAHVAQEMGSSLQTHLLSYWVRKRGAFTLEEAVKKITHDNAVAWDMTDRGMVREGFRADLNLFEEDRIRPSLPTVERDLPGGARRLVQKAEGIRATLVNGAMAFENGEATGAYAGTVLKGKIGR
ncbi:amidohydrolase family protein [Reyranella sp. MMS21-HV4-11]|uniref:Amidohydrolase family protein n=1 Tax=Reyranella humidisoli TaxID=2849149 RepID=A0ABS6IM68_9HYPH|nr:amidohydrolase family protein [Reyranella sp. MMS21-HV4-11]MBU8875684.1 amidohydrolase family protein [Reyranella sp. MMS21-HV4-11]